MTGEWCQINKFNCIKATATSTDNREIIVWFTTEILVSVGPESFGGLPGMILELNFDQRGIIYSALEISEKKTGQLSNHLR